MNNLGHGWMEQSIFMERDFEAREPGNREIVLLAV